MRRHFVRWADTRSGIEHFCGARNNNVEGLPLDKMLMMVIKDSVKNAFAIECRLLNGLPFADVMQQVQLG
jgi:hypothetical protein